MNKNKVIQFFKNDHNKLKKIIAFLNEEEIINDIIIEDWTVKDIIAHISAWNWEIIKAADTVLSDKALWYADTTEEEFNKKEIKKRKSWSLNDVLNEWDKSFKELMEKLISLTENEWNCKSNQKWLDGSPVSVESLFGYRYLNEGHEGGHAKQIRKHFKILF